jgi:serine/threonine-protein kinase
MKQQLGHYEIVAELGRGGMGVVYKGYEPSLNRYVAIKVLAESLAHDASVKERFLREARSMAALNDPHIIQIFFIGDDGGQTYFVMEFVDGESLSSLLKREGKLKPEQAAKIVYQTAQGLATAHDKGVIHRDIKPGNLMVTSRGAIKIADFGIALSTQDFSRKLTSTGEFVGTPGYLSPEVCQGRPVDQRSDIFSLGIVLFECLTGRMPFTDESPLGLMLEVVKAEIPDVCSLNAEVDPELSRILAKMVAKEPADRYSSCHELVADLAKHPLVAKGGPITLTTQLSPAAATVVGQKTPVSGARPSPSTTPTPRPIPAASVAPPAPVAHEPLAERQPAAKAPGRPLMPWAIAAILLLGVAGGAYAMRDRIPFLAQMFAPANRPAASTPSEPTLASPPPNTANAAPAIATSSAAPATPTPATPSGGLSVDQLLAQSQPKPAATAAVANSEAVSPQPVPQAEPSAEGHPAPAARASEVQPLKQLAAARAAETPPPPRLARATEPPPVVAPPRPHVPTVAVIGGGDVNVAEPAERAIAQMLLRDGYHVIDQASMPRVEHLLEGERPRFGEALQLLAKDGRVDAVVFVHARPVGTQQLTYYGQSSTLYTAQLGVRAYSVDQRRMLGPGWNDQVHYTSLNAVEKTNEAIEPMLREVEANLVDYRPRHDQG